jgi:hypothetical protein
MAILDYFSPRGIRKPDACARWSLYLAVACYAAFLGFALFSLSGAPYGHWWTRIPVVGRHPHRVAEAAMMVPAAVGFVFGCVSAARRGPSAHAVAGMVANTLFVAWVFAAFSE